MEAEDLDVPGGVAGEDCDVLAFVACDFCFDSDFEGAAADVAEHREQAGDFEVYFRHAADLVDAAVWPYETGAVVLASSAGDDSLGDQWIHAGNELENLGRSGVDVYATAGDRGEEIDQTRGERGGWDIVKSQPASLFLLKSGERVIG
jgi:hypothetical protein